MQNWQGYKTNQLVAVVLTALLTSCGSSGGGKDGNGNKNPEQVPVDLPYPENDPSAFSEPMIKDEKVVAQIEAQYTSDSERHAAAVVASTTLRIANANTPAEVQSIAHQQIENLLCYAHTVKTDERQEKIRSLNHTVLNSPELKASYAANYALLNGTLMSAPDAFLNGETCVSSAESSTGLDLLFGGSNHWNETPEPLHIDEVKYSLGPNCDKKHDGTVLVFGNGVGNDWDAAVVGLAEVVRRVEAEKKSRPDLKNLKYCIAHNNSRNFVADSMETFTQKTIEAELEDQIDRNLTGEALAKERKAKLDGILVKRGTPSMVGDMKKHIATYQNRIKISDGVVVLAHSQGSLFANMAMHGIDYAMRPRIAQVFVGPAAGLIYDHSREDFVSDTGRWTRFEDDRVIWAAGWWQNDQADVVCNPVGRVIICKGRDIGIKPLAATAGLTNSMFSSNHTLVNDYLKVDPARNMIMQHIVEAVRIVRRKPAPTATGDFAVEINWTSTVGAPDMHLDILEPAETAGQPGVQVYDKFVNGRGTMVAAGQDLKQRYELKCADVADGTTVYRVGFHTGYFTAPGSTISFNINVAGGDVGKLKTSVAKVDDTGTISKVRSLYEVEITRTNNNCTYNISESTTTHWQ